MADTGIFDVDEDFVRARLWDGNLLVLYWPTSLLDHLCPLFGWDGHFLLVVDIDRQLHSGWMCQWR